MSEEFQVTKNGSGSHERMFFLFSDVLLYAKHNMSLERPLLAKPYTCSSVIKLDDCKVDLVLGEQKIDGAGALFKLSYNEDHLLLYSTDNAEALSWIDKLQGAIETHKRNRASLRTPSVLEGRKEEAFARDAGRTPFRASMRIRNIRRKQQLASEMVSQGTSPSVTRKDLLYPMRKDILKMSDKKAGSSRRSVSSPPVIRRSASRRYPLRQHATPQPIAPPRHRGISKRPKSLPPQLSKKKVRRLQHQGPRPLNKKKTEVRTVVFPVCRNNPEAGDTVLDMDPGPQGDGQDLEGVEVIDTSTAQKINTPENIALSELKSQVMQSMQNPKALAALQGHFDSLVGMRSGYIESLPKVVKRRIKALKNIQVKHTEYEVKFYEEVHALECKYAKLYDSLYDKRRDVVTGTVEPTDSDCEWESSDDEEEEEEEMEGGKKEVNALAGDLKEKAKLTEGEEEEEESPSGIPGFWLTIFKNVDILGEMVQDHDEPILNHLNDIRVKFHEGKQMGFTLEFVFAANDYFTNTVLTKSYQMKSEPDEGDPFSFEGPEIFRRRFTGLEFVFAANDCFTNTVLTKSYQMKSEPDEGDPFSFEGPEIVGSQGCEIDWKKNKNVTVKVIKKKQKHKGRGTTRLVTKTVQTDSFFNFFNPPKATEEEVDEETEALLSADFEIGHLIRERIIPRAVLYFTGEAIEDDEFEEEQDDDDPEGEEGDEEDDNDPDFEPGKDGQKPAECNQQ
nr:nucleosome assembly protein 1-like 1 [Lytechinus pictus]